MLDTWQNSEYTSAQVYPTANKNIKIATERLLDVTRLALGSK